MPRTSLMRKSLKAICIDSVLFFAMFALVGHLSINFWERYTIQSELSTMKSSLHTLKDTITNIGKAYDNLHTELKDLFNMFDKKELSPTISECIHEKGRDSEKCKKAYNLGRSMLDKYQVQTVSVLTQSNKTKPSVGVMTDDKLHISKEPITKNAAANTKNPPKSIGITTNMSKYSVEQKLLNDSRPEYLFNNHFRCCKDIEHCKHICQYTNAKNTSTERVSIS